MSSEKYEQGLKKLEEISPGAAERTAASLNDIAPDMVARYPHARGSI